MDSSGRQKRRCSEESAETTKRQMCDSKRSNRPKRSMTLLEKLRQNRGTFTYRASVITGPCVLCNEELSLSWYDWKQHLLEHTDEKQFYCVECNTQMFDKAQHTSCPADTIIDVFGDQDVGCSLDGFICQLCDHFQINDYRLMKHLEQDHLSETHEDLGEFYQLHVQRVTLVPDVCPQENRIQITEPRYINRRERYRCGVGYCPFYGKTADEYSEHLEKAHRTFKTFYCPHCNLMINRKTESTVSVKNVFDHIEAHGTNIHQCFSCEYIESDENVMRSHITSEHYDLPIKYWRNNRRVPDPPDSELIEIVLDCALCGERVQNIPGAFDHFKEAHPGDEIHFNASKLIKSTTQNLDVTCSVDDTTLHYREVLVCGLCDDHFTNKHEWLKHFSGSHKSQALVVKREFKWLDLYKPSKNDGPCFDRKMLFFCAFCENLNGVKLMCSASVEGIYDHWEAEHKRCDSKPFRFCTAEFIGCYYCDVMSTFQGLGEHISKKHPGESFIAVKSFVASKQCALCDHLFNDNDVDEADDHFQTEHNLAMQADVFNPMRLKNNILLNLLQIDVHKKVMCEYCKEVFETRDEYRIHHLLKHSKLEKLSRAFVDKETIKLIGDCCHQQIDPNGFYDHLEFHTFTLKCEHFNSCAFQASDPFVFMKHQVKSHGKIDSLSSLYRNFMELRYWRSEMIFGNGLVINKFNTQGTEYDHSQSFDSFVTRLVAEKIQEYEGPTRNINDQGGMDEENHNNNLDDTW